MTTKELTEIVTKHDVSIAEINQALAYTTHNLLLLHESVKSLETVAESLLESANKHEAAIAGLEKQWQAYLTTRQN